MFFGSTSSRIAPSSCWRRQRLRKAMATARFAAPWPTMKRSSSETISRGEKVVIEASLNWLRIVEFAVIERQPATGRAVEDIDVALIETQIRMVVTAPRPDHLRRALIEPLDDDDEARAQPGQIGRCEIEQRARFVDAVKDRPAQH